MKRDDELIRALLIDLEASPDTMIVSSLHMGSDDHEVRKNYHLQLLCDSGLMAQVQPSVFRMTNQGHDYLAAVRSDTIWNKTKAGAGQLGGVTLGIMKDIAVAYLKQEAKAKLGIELP